LIKEGSVYNLSYFRVRKSGKYRPVDNDHMINFTRWTSVEEVVEIPPAFPMYTYSLTPMEQLPPRAEETTFFTGISLYVQRL
jgi:replication factor A1